MVRNTYGMRCNGHKLYLVHPLNQFHAEKWNLLKILTSLYVCMFESCPNNLLKFPQMLRSPANVKETNASAVNNSTT